MRTFEHSTLSVASKNKVSSYSEASSVHTCVRAFQCSCGVSGPSVRTRSLFTVRVEIAPF